MIFPLLICTFPEKLEILAFSCLWNCSKEIMNGDDVRVLNEEVKVERNFCGSDWHSGVWVCRWWHVTRGSGWLRFFALFPIVGQHGELQRYVVVKHKWKCLKMESGALKWLNTCVSGQKWLLIVVVGQKCKLGTQECVERFGNAYGDSRTCARVRIDDTAQKWVQVAKSGWKHVVGIGNGSETSPYSQR